MDHKITPPGILNPFTRLPCQLDPAQLLPDDRKIEWAGTLDEAEALLVGIRAEQSAGPAAAASDLDRLERARIVFRDMRQEYATGNFVRYGELLQQLAKILLSP